MSQNNCSILTYCYQFLCKSLTVPYFFPELCESVEVIVLLRYAAIHGKLENLAAGRELPFTTRMTSKAKNLEQKRRILMLHSLTWKNSFAFKIFLNNFSGNIKFQKTLHSPQFYKFLKNGAWKLYLHQYLKS